MLIAVFSDIHANLVALETAMASARRRGAEVFVSLGDVVGYGPRPSECVDLVREEFAVSVLGNHDDAVAGGPLDELPRDGRAAALQHREVLSDEQLAWLGGLPLTAHVDSALLVHAAPDQPERWPRLESFSDTQRQFKAFDEPICFLGHSHRPAIVSATLGVFRVRRGHRFLVNVGSVGQPRDSDPRLAYALFDPEAFTVELVREHYDHARTAIEISRAGLPPRLGHRLRMGL